MKAKVNYNAVGTWLEPYIGHEFTFINETRQFITIEFDYGNSGVRLRKLEKKYFDLKRE